MSALRTLALALAGATTVAACAPNVARLHRPTHVDAYCGSKQARMTGVESVVTSTDGKLLDDAPTLAEVRRAVRAGEGVIAYWNDQPIALGDEAAKALGNPDAYVHVVAAAVPAALEGAHSRHIYLEVRDRGALRWVTLQAFDTQDVCVEGKPDV